MMRKFVWLYLMVFPLLAFSQNFLNNANFDTDLSNWTIEGVVHSLWDAMDINASNSSGSVLLFNNLTTASSDLEVLSQCISNPVNGQYVYTLSAFIPSGQSTSGSIVMRSYRYSSTDCSGQWLGSGGYTIANSDNLDVWQSNTGMFSIVGHKSIKYVLVIRKTENSGTFIAYADAAQLIHDIQIFADGFES
jgi:hypothetical protein